VAIADHEKVLVHPDGLDAGAVEELVRRRQGKTLPSDFPGVVRRREAFGRVAADVFVSAAVSGTIDVPRLDLLRRQGVATIACGANQPFREAKLGSTRVQRLADDAFTVIPDVVANCGMARAFSFLMQNPTPADAGSVFAAVEATIGAAIAEITRRNEHDPTGLLAAALELALDRIERA
jgi:glutamate dehydrogenase/leucine dehydrogenase